MSLAAPSLADNLAAYITATLLILPLISAYIFFGIIRPCIHRRRPLINEQDIELNTIHLREQIQVPPRTAYYPPHR